MQRQMWQMWEGDRKGCEHTGCTLERVTIALWHRAVCWLLSPVHRCCIHLPQQRKMTQINFPLERCTSALLAGRVIQGNVLICEAGLAVPSTGAVQVSMQGWNSSLSPFVRRRAGGLDWGPRKSFVHGRRKGTECGSCLGSSSLECIPSSGPGWVGLRAAWSYGKVLCPGQGELELNNP